MRTPCLLIPSALLRTNPSLLPVMLQILLCSPIRLISAPSHRPHKGALRDDYQHEDEQHEQNQKAAGTAQQMLKCQ